MVFTHGIRARFELVLSISLLRCMIEKIVLFPVPDALGARQ